MRLRRHLTLWFGICLLTVLVVSTFLSACGGKATTPTASTTPMTTTAAATGTAATTTTTPAEKPLYGGTLKIITQPPSFNLGIPGQRAWAFDPIYSLPCIEYLTRRDNANAAVLPGLATSWKAAPDNKSVTFTLRKGVKFHDGTDFNAQAVKYCIDLEIAGGLQTVRNVSSVDVIDDSNVRINLKGYDVDILNGWTTIMMASPTALKSLGQDALFHPVGTGPYKFVSYTRDVSLKYTRNDDYWGGKPYLDGLEFNFIADLVTASAALRAKEAQAFVRCDQQAGAELKKLGTLQFNTCYSGAWGFVMDSKNTDSPWSNLKVRQAAAYATDTKAIAGACTFGWGVSINQFAAPPGSMNTWGNPNVVGYPFNPDKAKALLKEAGYPNGFDTNYWAMAQAPWMTSLAEGVQGFLSAVGIKVNLTKVDPARENDYENNGWKNGLLMFNLSISALDEPGRQFEYQLAGMPPPGGRYVSVVMPADYLPKVKAAIAEQDPAKRLKAFQEVGKMVIDDYCLSIPVFTGVEITAYYPEVRDYDVNALAAFYWHPENVWLKK